MNNLTISPAKKIRGKLALPGDKSISHRAIMMGALAEGETLAKNFLNSLDCIYTIKAFKSLGVRIESHNNDVIVHGRGLGSFRPPSKEIYLGNSGTSMRLLSGILSAQPFQTTLAGDESLSRRPMDRVIKPLRMMGAEIKATDDKFPPIVIKGNRLKPIKYESPVASAQVKSAIMLAALYADGTTSISEPVRSRDHTEKILKYFGANVFVDGLTVSVKGPARLRSRTLEIPGDISSAAFFIAAALLLDDSEITLTGVLHNPTRLGLVNIFKKMSAAIEIKNIRQNGPEEICDISVRSSRLRATDIDSGSIPSVIDELPMIMVAGCFAEGETRIYGASELRVKETDRINSMVTNLKKMGADISVSGDDILIRGATSLRPAQTDSFGDHRTAMSMAIAGLAARGGPTTIEGADCIDTSFPGFSEVLNRVIIR